MKKHREAKPPRSSLRSTLLRPLLLSLLLPATPAGFGADIAPRIVGGVPSEDGNWPWMAAILQRAVSDMHLAPFCGGTLIRPSWVMTAAHCVFDDLGNLRPPEFIDVLVGEIDLLAGGDRIPVARIIPYPDFVLGNRYDDIALLQLETPAPQQPVQLPGPTFPAQFHNPVVSPDAIATAIGWGRVTAGNPSPSPDEVLPIGDTGNFSPFPDELREVDLPIVDKATCQRATFGLVPLKETNLCAGFAGGGKNVCFGDSGGPLVAQSAATGNRPVQLGITSSVLSRDGSCADRGPGGYGFYTRVSSYSLWISENSCSPAERPAAPVITLSLIGSDGQLDFAPVPGATGYRLYWAPYPDTSPVFQLDIGTATSVSATLPSGTQLWVAVDAYNGNCLGPFSNIEPLLVP